jgi:hypothetical protein
LGGGTLSITGSAAFSSAKNFTLTAASTINNSNAGGATLSVLFPMVLIP